MRNKYQFECRYCGHSWTETIFSAYDLEQTKCTKCHDKDIIARSLDTKDVFGYYSGSKDDAYIKKEST